MSDSTDSTPAAKTKGSSGWKTQFWVFCGMLLLALIGIGLSQALERGAWEYWLFVVVVYAGIGHWRSRKKAKQQGQAVAKLLSRELAHWAWVLVFLGIVLFLERREIIDRQAAADLALLLLALSCCLAGVHIDWSLMVVGVALGVMLVAMALLEQYTIALWTIMFLVAASAAAFFYFKARRDAGSGRQPVE